ncbi:hypothetical protein O181_039020, partial [Austropuccinia psidii MF-1]|nr:hypothetical protein [Austropuccinia psidii MF-1]
MITCCHPALQQNWLLMGDMKGDEKEECWNYQPSNKRSLIRLIKQMPNVIDYFLSIKKDTNRSRNYKIQ